MFAKLKFISLNSFTALLIAFFMTAGIVASTFAEEPNDGATITTATPTPTPDEDATPTPTPSEDDVTPTPTPTPMETPYVNPTDPKQERPKRDKPKNPTDPTDPMPSPSPKG